MKNGKFKILLSALLFSLVSVFGNAQQYFVNDHAYFNLEDSVHFSYRYGGFCGSAPSGKGTYKKEGNKITFQFSPKRSKPNFQITDNSAGYNDISNFKIRIICLEDSVNSFPYVNLYYLDSLNKKIAKYTDFDGICEFNINTNNFRDTVFVRCVGIPNFEIPVLPFSQTIEIILPAESPFEIHDKVEVFRIGRKNKLLPIEN